MQIAMLRPLSGKEYLEGEERADIRHEYVAGQVYAMARAKLRHNQIAGNLYGLLWQKARGSHCQVLNSDMKVRVEAVDAFYYPDVVLRCGAPLSGDTLYLEDPCLIVEVSSKYRRRARRMWTVVKSYKLIRRSLACRNMFWWIAKKSLSRHSAGILKVGGTSC
ncbi:hypothetical protein A6M27_11935 [Acidithiobacillus thiooxidans]|uniref:Putative restriction endonuclease domain-containing protein n=1 Tax=Acidithiobacillus thiooxidans TaxID=930 RepID=A0A1C2I3I0_ACITH|nr:Uma2 family endonuclease [Acidithiobacillus thiooxidans]OCX70447.1 hypothetical protein A6P07_14280 [Acidithiobacillus thiooxidans]OCX79943.1 hypothetical protein A6O24_00315 [Acidithiobacillus thiooxidans]OCX82624.1 hypothetical protein A6O26_09440 [Acidithiobacillus thiooxidans]OCX86719.1 hypothetical protein A6M27_11935 [Acidithiobacillus thiooxidans]